MKQLPLKFTEETKLQVGDYFRAYKSKYFTCVKEIIENQRNFEIGYGEYKTTLVRVDIYDKNETLLITNSIVPISNIISGALARYIPDLKYDPSYLGNADPFNFPIQHKIWRDMIDRCFDCTDPVFPYIGAIGTTVCDRWRCFEYFVADFKHIEGYAEAEDKIFHQHYIVDLYDKQKYIHPSKRIYAPGYVKLKPFKQSDICKYLNLPPKLNNYPKDLETTMQFRTKEMDIKTELFLKQTGININIDLDTASYYYNNNIGYQPLTASSDPCYHRPMRNMCSII